MRWVSSWIRKKIVHGLGVRKMADPAQHFYPQTRQMAYWLWPALRLHKRTLVSSVESLFIFITCTQIAIEWKVFLFAIKVIHNKKQNRSHFPEIWLKWTFAVQHTLFERIESEGEGKGIRNNFWMGTALFACLLVVVVLFCCSSWSFERRFVVGWEWMKSLPPAQTGRFLIFQLQAFIASDSTSVLHQQKVGESDDEKKH